MDLPRFPFWLMDLPPSCLECLLLIAHSCLLHWHIALGCRNWFKQGYAPLEGAAQGPILAARGSKANTLASFDIILMRHSILGAPAAGTLQVSFSHCPVPPSFFPCSCSSPGCSLVNLLHASLHLTTCFQRTWSKTQCHQMYLFIHLNSGYLQMDFRLLLGFSNAHVFVLSTEKRSRAVK